MLPFHNDAFIQAAGDRNLQLPPAALPAQAFDSHLGGVHPADRQIDPGLTELLVVARPDPVDAVDGLGRTRLMHAAQQGSVEVIAGLLQDGAMVNSVDNLGDTALCLAVRGGHGAVAQALLLARADPDIGSNGGISPLMLAARGGFDGVVEMLAQGGANIEAIDHAGYTALMHAVYNDHIEAVNALLEGGANPSALTPFGMSPLSLAALLGHPVIAYALLREGADLHPGGSAHVPALFDAALNGHLDVVGVLRNAGVDLQANLHYAAANGMAQAASALLRAGANVNAPPHAGAHTPLMAAALAGHTEVVDVLVLGGADIQADLLTAAELGMGRLVAALALAGADVNRANNLASTPLMLAAENDQVDAVTALLEAGADVHARMPMAAQHGDAGNVQVLLDAANGDAFAYGEFTALMFAALNGHGAVVQELLMAAADIDTDLRTAAARGLAELVTVLAQAGGNVNGVDHSGLSALMWAAANNRLEAVNPLVELHADVHARVPMTAPINHAGDVEAVVNGADGDHVVALNGFTALMLAGIHGHALMVGALENVGADIDVDLRMAAQHGMDSFVVFALADAGADVNAATEEGITPLMLAAMNGHVAVVDALSRVGADIYAISDDGLTAADMALSARHLHVVDLLRAAHQANPFAVGEAIEPFVPSEEDIPMGAVQGAQVAAPWWGTHALDPSDLLTDTHSESCRSTDVWDNDEPMDDVCSDYFHQVELVGMTQPT